MTKGEGYFPYDWDDEKLPQNSQDDGYFTFTDDDFELKDDPNLIKTEGITLPVEDTKPVETVKTPKGTVSSSEPDAASGKDGENKPSDVVKPSGTAKSPVGIVPPEEAPPEALKIVGLPLTRAQKIQLFWKQWDIFIVIMLTGPIICVASQAPMTLPLMCALSAFPIAYLGIRLFFRNSKNRWRVIKTVVVIFAIIGIIITALAIHFQPKVVSTTDILGSINSAVGDIYGLQKTLSVPNTQSQGVQNNEPTSAPASANASDLCSAATKLIKISGSTIQILKGEKPISTTEVNVHFYWIIDGQLMRLDPGSQYTSRGSVENVQLDHITVIQNGDKKTYPCSH